LKPAEVAVASLSPLTATGASLLVSVPSPSCPLPLPPQARPLAGGDNAGIARAVVKPLAKTSLEGAADACPEIVTVRTATTAARTSTRIRPYLRSKPALIADARSSLMLAGRPVVLDILLPLLAR
jgi:hypothetical protein